jgi:oligopeptidase A
MSIANPLLDTAGLPSFDRIAPAHVEPAMDALLQQADTALETAVSDSTPATYEAVSAHLDVATERLGRAWGAVNHLTAVAHGCR